MSRLRLMGKKRGMTRLFNENGELVVCTVIEAQANVVSQIKKKEVDGYTALQVAAVKVSPSKAKNVTKPMKGHFLKAGVDPRSHMVESRIDDVESFQIGQELSFSLFANDEYLDVCGVSKGKGYQGVMKRHGFAGGPASHGSGFHRHAGSTGMRSSPGRNLPGGKKAGRMGGERVTQQNVKVFRIDEEKQVIIVEGSIPGPSGALVVLSKAVKMQGKKKKAAPKKDKK